MADPDITVVIPVAPRAPWLGEAVASVLEQSYAKWRLVVVLDGECGSNRSALERLDLGTRLQVVANRTPQGVSASLNRGLRIADTELVARLDADDVCLPHRLSEQVRCLVARPDLWVLGSSAIVFDAEGNERLRSAPSGTRAVARRLRWRNAIIHPSVVMRRDPILSLGGYNERSERSQDYELWLRVLASAQLDNLAAPLIRYRLHSDQHSRGSRLQGSKQIWRARRQAADSPAGRLIADARHVTWMAAQGIRTYV